MKTFWEYKIIDKKKENLEYLNLMKNSMNFALPEVFPIFKRAFEVTGKIFEELSEL